MSKKHIRTHTHAQNTPIGIYMAKSTNDTHISTHKIQIHSDYRTADADAQMQKNIHTNKQTKTYYRHIYTHT